MTAPTAPHLVAPPVADGRPLVSFLALLLRRPDGAEFEDLARMLTASAPTAAVGAAAAALAGDRAVGLAHILAPLSEADDPVAVLHRAHMELGRFADQAQDLPDVVLARIVRLRADLAVLTDPAGVPGHRLAVYAGRTTGAPK